MHLPDGYLCDPVCAATAAASTAALTWSILQLRTAEARPRATLMAAVGAGVFAAHAINVPVDHGTSGHLLGAAAAAMLLGPWAASLTITVVLALECLLFGDGGLGALGANVLNMAVLAPWMATTVLMLAGRQVSSLAGTLPICFLAGFGSTLLAAMTCACELAVSGTSPALDVFPAMCQSHGLIAVAEGCITAGLAAMIWGRRRGESRSFVPAGLAPPALDRRAEWSAIAVALSAGILLAPWASALPDGLEKVARTLNFAEPQAAGSWTLAPDYALPGIESIFPGEWGGLALALPIVLGIGAVYLTTYGVGRLCLARGRK